MGAALLALAQGLVWWGTGALLPLPLGELKATEQAVQLTHYLLEGDVAPEEEYHVLGLVVALVKAHDVLRAVGAEAAGMAQDVAAQGVPVEHQVFKIVENLLTGSVLVTLYLIAHYFYLPVHLPLREGALEHYVGEQLGSPAEMLTHEGGIDHGLFLVGKGVKVAPHCLHAVQDVPGTAVTGALEEQVLQVMGHAALLFLLIARAAIYHKATVGHRGGTGTVQDAKAAR